VRGQPYRYTLLDIPPLPYRHSVWRRFLRRCIRLRFRLFGDFCKRNPWPCPMCGRRTRAAVEVYQTFYYRQALIIYRCCNWGVNARSSACAPYSRQRVRAKNEEQVLRWHREILEDSARVQRVGLKEDE
jgi:hypothetical protein